MDEDFQLPARLLLAYIFSQVFRAQCTLLGFLFLAQRGDSNQAIGFYHVLENSLSAWRIPSDTDSPVGSCLTATSASRSL